MSWRLLDGIVEGSCGDHVVRSAGVIQERRDLDRVFHKWRPIESSVLSRVNMPRVLECLLGFRQASNRIGNASSRQHEPKQSIDPAISEKNMINRLPIRTAGRRPLRIQLRIVWLVALEASAACDAVSSSSLVVELINSPP